MTGYNAFKQKADEIKQETQEVDQQVLAQSEQAKEELNQLAVISNNAELAQMYASSANIGAGNLAGELPILKVHATGKSTKNELADGSEPNDGWFFYKPTGEQFKDPIVHILSISRGFKAEGIVQKDGTAKMVFNQIMSGMIIDGTEMKPFIMYFTGLKLNNLWEFGKVASKYTKAKPFGIPMFALTVKLTTEKKENNYGRSWIVNFDLVNAEDGKPKLVLDPDEFTFLKISAEAVEEQIESLIQSKTVKGEDEEVQFINGTSVKASDDMPFGK